MEGIRHVTSPANWVYIMAKVKNSKKKMAGVLNSIWARERKFTEKREARELIKNRELNLYVSRDRLSHRTKIIISRWAFGSQPSAVIARVLNKNAVSWQTRNNRKLPKHKLSQNAKNLQCLLKFGLIEDGVTVFQRPWNSEFG